MSSSERSSPAAAEIDPSGPAVRRCSGNPGFPPWGLEEAKLQEIHGFTWGYVGKSMGLHGEIMDLHGYALETWRCPVNHFYIPKTPTNIF